MKHRTRSPGRPIAAACALLISGCDSVSGIVLQTLNGISIRRDGAEISLQPKRLLLLLYLLLEGGDAAVRRDQLVAVFWPDADPDRARNALRQAIFGLRSTFGADVIVTRGASDVAVRDGAITCDAVDLLAAADASDFDTVDQLYRTEFLGTGPHGADSPELERWLEDMRLRLRRVATMAARSLSGRADLSFTDHIARLERLSVLAPYDESAAMGLVAAYLGEGDRSAAVEAYRLFSARLRADLEIEPSDAFVRLLDTARNGEGAPRVDTPPRTQRIGVTQTSAARKKNPARWRWPVILGAVVLSLGGFLLRPAVVDLRLVEVVPFTHQPNNDEAIGVAKRAAEQIRGSLAKIPGVRVLAATGKSVASRQRPGTLVLGGIEQTGNGRWRAWATVTATETDMLLYRSEAEGNAADSVLVALVDRVSTVVATRRDMEVHWGETLHRPMVLAALEHYLSAFDAVATGDAEVGIMRYESAWKADSTFLFAGILAAGNALSINEFARGDSLLAALAPFEARMLPLERHQYLRARAIARSDVQATLTESRAAAQLEPNAPFLLAQYAQDAYLANRPLEAVRAADALDRVSPRPRGIAEINTIRAAALHTMGKFENELSVVDSTIARQPAPTHFAALRIAPLAALGRFDSISVTLAATEARDGSRDVGRLYRVAALELAAHGFAREATEAFALGVQWFGRHPITDATGVARQISALELLLDAGDTTSTRDLAARLMVKSGKTLTDGQRSALLSIRGQLAISSGHAHEARAISDTLAMLAERGRNGIETYRRARIMAGLGDIDGALRLIEQALQEGFVTHREFHVDRSFVKLHSDPRFQRITAPRG